MNDLLTQLDERGARKLCAKIKDGIEDVKTLIIQLYEGQGWTAIGYSSWTECCREEFDKSAAWASKQAKLIGKVGCTPASLSCQNKQPIEVMSELVNEESPEPEEEPDDDTDSLETEAEAKEPESEPQACWIADSANELAFACGNAAMVAEIFGGMADLVRTTDPCVLAARLENAATKLRDRSQ